MDRNEALNNFPNEVKLIEQCNCECIGYTIWPDKIVRFFFNTKDGDTLVIEKDNCNKDKIMDKVNKAANRRK